jgi:anti-sigma regulatory factor (Ser/Thr protein kinase)
MESRFARRIEVLDDVFNFVEEYFAENDLDTAERYAIGMAIEEVFTNMVKYNPEGKGDILIRLGRERDCALIDLTDFDSDAFDPTQAPDVDVNGPIGERTPGGLGIHLVRKLMDGLDYEYHGRESTIKLVKKLHPHSKPGAAV